MLGRRVVWPKWALILVMLLAAACSAPSDHEAASQDNFNYSAPLPKPEGRVLLTITGKITRTNAAGKAEFDRAMLEAMPQHSLNTDTSVTDGIHHFNGVLVRDLLKRVGASGKAVKLMALNNYVVEVPVRDFQQYDVIAAWAMDAITLTPKDKGPLWVVYPRSSHEELRDIRYDYRWVWQLVRIDVQ